MSRTHTVLADETIHAIPTWGRRRRDDELRRATFEYEEGDDAVPVCDSFDVFEERPMSGKNSAAKKTKVSAETRVSCANI